MSGHSVVLGRTGLVADKNGFGALPIQRVSHAAAAKLLRRAYEAGITYYDTARAYSDSEEKIGEALADVRGDILLATKTMASTGAALRADLETSLRLLRTDCIDVYQLHNPAVCPKPGDGSGLYEALLEARAQGLIRHIGITSHRHAVAMEAAASGLYAVLQYPFSYLADQRDLAVVEACRDAGMGFVAMKALAGGLLTNAAAAYAYLAGFDYVLPIWGVQRDRELEEFLAFRDTPPALDDGLRAVIERDRRELAGEFCRGCGYCQPCPAGIAIHMCARMSLMLRRAPTAVELTEEGQARMAKIEDCTHCGSCRERCPYGLDIPALLEKNLRDYREVLAGKPLDPPNGNGCCR